MPTADASNPIEAVRARLDGGRKWIQGSLGQVDNPAASVCIMGALTHVARQRITDRDPLYRVVQGVCREQFPDRSIYHWGDGKDVCEPAKFNDHPDTTWADVDLVLDKAARRWDEQVRP